MKIITPEELLGKPLPKICCHFGTCDYCKNRLTPVLHLNYNEALKRDFRICLDCADEITLWLAVLKHDYKKYEEMRKK